MIRLDGVRKTFTAGETQIHALDGVSLEIERGEFVAIMGQSGSGKSTMMNIVGLLDRSDDGAYLLSGQN
ncbi:MAG: ATP-binding cassette domain-containing protein, partial [Chloroflexi bacterium]|nr:ATP-binding cassette domain-containing protein [Chloroflexota bacterium]